MKVLLINPRWPGAKAGRKRIGRAWPPLDLLNAAALLREHGHEVFLIDARAPGESESSVRIKAWQADLVLFQTSPLDRWQCPDLNWNVLEKMCAGLPGDRLVIAGAHGTVRPERVLEMTGAMAVIRGEPEQSLADLAGAGGDPGGISGLSYYTDNIIINEPDRDLLDLDVTPFPAYDLINPKNYFYELMGRRLALVETSRGCPFNCSFCFKAMYGSGVRYKSVERVLAEIEDNVQGWGARYVYFMDLEFTMDRERILELCRGLVELNLDFEWCCQTRVDSVDPELLKEMKKAGCRLVHFGVETGSIELLKATGKKITMEQARKAIGWCGKAGLETACFFLFGLPGERAADRKATTAFARALNPTYASFHAAAPYPGTKLSEAGGSGYPEGAPGYCLEEHDLSLLKREIRRAFLSFYLRPKYATARLSETGLRENLRKISLFLEFIK